jgi:metal-responsive CopG/Arc/MetJ family transcriptional regulator
MERTTRQFTISMPPDLARQVTATAKAESRTVSELFREAFRTYRAARIRAILDESQRESAAKGHMGYKPEDVERLIHESRREQEAEEKAQRKR